MRIGILTAALLIAPLVAEANVELTVKSDHTTFAVKGVQTTDDKNPPSSKTIHLTLGTHWVQWDSGTDRGVYDFAKRIVITVDPQAHRLVEDSLYAVVSSRAAELENRRMMSNSVASAQPEDSPLLPTLAEHELALRGDTQRASGIERKGGDGEQRYLWGKKELFAYSTKLLPLPPADRDLYIRYVRYTVGGHPEILADLQKLDGIPKWLRYRDPANGNAQQLAVLESRRAPDGPYSLPALEKATLKNPAAAAAAAAVAASTPDSRAIAVARILTQANEAADAGKPLQAMLGYLERRLMIDGEMPPDFTKRAEVIVRDENVRALLGAFQAENEIQAKACIATLVGLAHLAGDKAYVVGIFRANMEIRLGNAETATGLLVAALTKNPFITGVWKDLGDSLDTGFDSADTWRCYEIARLIAPAHGLLAEIALREAALAKEHPEYF